VSGKLIVQATAETAGSIRRVEILSFDMPGLKTRSLTNQHTHWRVKDDQARTQRNAVKFAWLAWCGDRRLQLGETAEVDMVRIAPGELDDDNLPAALKSVRDEIAKQLGVDDRDKRVRWQCHQERGRRGEYSVRIRVEFRFQS
jgi:hypothetical protein